MSPTLQIELPALHDGQREVRDSASRFRVLACGRRWGKTRLGVALSIESALRGGRAWWVAPDYKRAEEGWSLIRQFARLIPGTHVREVDRQAAFQTGGVLEVRSADAPDSLRGAGLNFLVIDEAAFVKEAAWVEALRPTLSDNAGRALFISTPAGRNWFWRIWQRGHEGGDWQSWQFPTVSNPHIDPLEIEAARGDMPERTFSQEYLADFSENEGVFFPEWSEAKHVCDPISIPEDWLRWIAVDWGYADPWCVYWFARTPDKKHTYLYREAYQRGLRDEQQAALIKQLTGKERIRLVVGDPSMFNKRVESGRPSIASIYHQAKVPLSPASNARKPGWQAVRRCLAGDDPQLRVFRTCKNLIRTMPEQVFDPLDIEDLADKVKGVKTEDHPADTLRYGIFAMSQPIPEIKLTDFEFQN